MKHIPDVSSMILLRNDQKWSETVSWVKKAASDFTRIRREKKESRCRVLRLLRLQVAGVLMMG